MFWYRRHEIHVLSLTPSGASFSGNIDPNLTSSETVKFSEQRVSFCFVRDINRQRTYCKKPEIEHVSLHHLVLEHLYFVSANEQEINEPFSTSRRTQQKLQQHSDDKTKYSYPTSITNSNNLFGPFKKQDATSSPFLLLFGDGMYQHDPAQ